MPTQPTFVWLTDVPDTIPEGTMLVAIDPLDDRGHAAGGITEYALVPSEGDFDDVQQVVAQAYDAEFFEGENPGAWFVTKVTP